MNPSKIRFNCPSCGIQLDVPAALAGVTGPCPSCQNTITAPHPEPATPTTPAFPPSQPEPRVETPQPTVGPAAPVEAAPSPSAGQNVFPTVVPDPIRPEVKPYPDEPPFPIEPEPMRELPTQRSGDGMASHAPSPIENRPSANEASRNNASGKTKQGSRIPSILFLLIALLVMAVGVIAILDKTGVVGLNSLRSLLGPETKNPPTQQVTPPPTKPPVEIDNPESPSAKPTPAPESKPDALEIDIPDTNIPPPELPEGEEFREGETPLPEGIGIENDPGEVQKILERFLAARSLGERRPFLAVESLKKNDIASGPLAEILPKPTSTLFWGVQTDEQEKRNDFYYIVSWDGSLSSPTKPMAVELHKWEGSESPKVHSEAFLEFYTQKLARYAASPLDRPARFFVIAECVAKCFETEAVAEHSSKATLKMGSFPNDRSPVKAYFDKKGDILEELKEYRNGAAFQEGLPMTVTLAWSNESESEGPRYLELIQIDSFDWHP